LLSINKTPKNRDAPLMPMHHYAPLAPHCNLTQRKGIRLFVTLKIQLPTPFISFFRGLSAGQRKKISPDRSLPDLPEEGMKTGRKKERKEERVYVSVCMSECM
jgi:hypothetical protein